MSDDHSLDIVRGMGLVISTRAIILRRKRPLGPNGKRLSQSIVNDIFRQTDDAIALGVKFLEHSVSQHADRIALAIEYQCAAAALRSAVKLAKTNWARPAHRQSGGPVRAEDKDLIERLGCNWRSVPRARLIAEIRRQRAEKKLDRYDNHAVNAQARRIERLRLRDDNQAI